MFVRCAALLVVFCFCSSGATAYVSTKAIRARDLGVPFEGKPGELNAITDVRGVTVGQTTLIEGEGKLVVGQGPVRTGVTAIFPLGKENSDTPVPAAVYSFNGNGEMTGAEWVEESGFLEGPVLLTNTHSVGVVRDAVVEWGTRKFPDTEHFSLPVVAETWDGELNDINGFHVKRGMSSARLIARRVDLLRRAIPVAVPECGLSGSRREPERLRALFQSDRMAFVSGYLCRRISPGARTSWWLECRWGTRSLICSRYFTRSLKRGFHISGDCHGRSVAPGSIEKACQTRSSRGGPDGWC